MGPNVVEAIAARHLVDGPRDRPLRPGDLVTLRPSVVMTHDNTSAILARFRALGASRVLNPERAVVALDHDIQNRGDANARKYAAIEAFAREQGMTFYPAGSGIGHQLMVERGHVRPGDLAVAADSHATTYGALGALGLAVARSDAAGIWAAGLFWWEVPETVRVELLGTLPPGSTGKDVALALCALYPADVLGAAVEFAGPGAASLSVDDRLTIANMAADWGAVCGVFPDGADAGVAARYAATIVLDLDDVGPHVSGPDTLARSSPVYDLARERIRIDKAYLVSCANARTSDLEAAAEQLRGRRVADGVELYVAAASAAVERDATARGAWGALLDAGARPLPSGCGPCIGLGAGLLRPGETGISASNRNFPGRMGSPDARCYLASPAVVAASAAAGYLRAPLVTSGRRPTRSIERHVPEPAPHPLPPRPVDGFPRRVEGRAVLFLREGIDTDALCPARLVYEDAASPGALRAGLLASLAPGFSEAFRRGDVLIAGARFGIGSSREQAARALLASGIVAVVAASFAPVFRRNALNNGLIAVASEPLVTALARRRPDAARGPKVADESVAIDFDSGTIAFRDLREPMDPLPEMALRLIASHGLEGFLRDRIPR